MHDNGEEKGQLKCSFCGKTNDQVKKLIAGPGVYICDKCVAACQALVDERKAQGKKEPTQ